MNNIVKMRVTTHPLAGHSFELICSFNSRSFLYKNDQTKEERFRKMNDEQFNRFLSILELINALKPLDYQGPITNDGMYWEFDLVNDRNKMVEIEGINMIDEEVIRILSELEEVINYPLGVNEFKQSVSYDS